MSTTSVALISVGGTLGGALLALIGTLVTQYVTGRREDKRREHEHEIKRMELDEIRAERLHSERLSAYRALLTKVDLMLVHTNKEFLHDIGVEQSDTLLKLIEEIGDANSAIDLLASPGVREAADQLAGQAIYVMMANIKNQEVSDKRIRSQEQTFAEAAREELGISDRFLSSERLTHWPQGEQDEKKAPGV